MWTDNETDRDLLNFTGVAQSIAELVIQVNGKPISIGVSGAWGIGKSSMIQLTKTALRERAAGAGTPEFVFVDFNAWLYQGYDDARAALMDVIAAKLQEIAEEKKAFQDKAKELLARVNWYRVGRFAASTAISLASGLHPAGIVGGTFNVARSVFGNKGGDDGNDAKNEEKWLKDKPNETPPQEIQALRDSFEDLLGELKVTLVVLIDDLDRCLPETTISTLEAIRLFLFMNNSAFVIAADQAMIKYAVKRHFKGVNDESLVTSYFDKLIQVPIRVPSLGLQEVRAYLMMLFVDDSTLDYDDKEKIRAAIAGRLQQSWKGMRVDRAFVASLKKDMPPELINRLDLAERIAPIMSDTTMTSGNPRLIKRFLNALSIRMALGKAQGVNVNEEVLAKLLIFERSDNSKAYAELMASVANNDEGKPEMLKQWEEDLAVGKAVEFPANWTSPFLKTWLELKPALAEEDLRGALYVSREHAPLVSRDDRLSAEAAELLSALLKTPDMAHVLESRIAALPKADLALFMSRILERARKEDDWGAPDILKAALVVARADDMQAATLAAFLHDLPAHTLSVPIVPLIEDQPWAKELFKHWLTLNGLKGPMRKRISKE
jgi:predicted KAP-like P-loop ATPase